MGMTNTRHGNSTVKHGAAFALGGFAFFALHDAIVKSLAEYSSFQIAFFAVLFSYVPFSFSLVADKQERHLRPVNPAWVALRSLCMAASLLLAFTAFTRLPLAQTYALLFSTPVIITLLAIPVLGERVHIFRWFAIGLGLIGVFIALQPGKTTLGLGHIAALLAVLCSATSAVATRRIAASERSATLILYPLLTNVVVSGALLYFVYQPMPLGDLARMAAIGALGMAGQFFIIAAYRSGPAAFVAPFQYSQLVWAILYGYLWFDETPNRHVILGAAIIILSGLLIVWRESVSGVSRNRPFLRTRNVRGSPAAPMRTVESEE
jgi:S-adenosylmethionine uptake transporter